jgi:hypothetical protein
VAATDSTYAISAQLTRASALFAIQPMLSFMLDKCVKTEKNTTSI